MHDNLYAFNCIPFERNTIFSTQFLQIPSLFLLVINHIRSLPGGLPFDFFLKGDMLWWSLQVFIRHISLLTELISILNNHMVPIKSFIRTLLEGGKSSSDTARTCSW